MNEENKEEDVTVYGDDAIVSLDAPVATWLKMIYISLPIWGIIWLFLFWNGSTVPWFDRGHWNELQRAALTTFPEMTYSKIEQAEK